MSLDNLKQRFQAPFFYYDLDGFESHAKRIKSILHPEIRVWYACKANPLSKILSILDRNGFGVDVASLGELAQAKSAGVKDLIATGPAKSKSYLSKLMDARVSTIVIESLNQLRDVNELARERKTSQPVLLRVQLDWPSDLKSVLGGSSITPFGLGLAEWRQINLSEYAHLNVLGLHCFQWGNVMDLGQLKQVWTQTISECLKLSQDLKLDLKILDLGGGLGVDYKGTESITFEEVHSLLLSLKSEFMLKEIWLELGRFMMAEFGTYLTPVIDVKTVRGKNIIVTEGGINHIARPALVNEAFPAVHSVGETTYAVHGPLCTALDFLGEFNFGTVKPGDWIEFKKVGAYGFTESMPFFLCHDLPGEAFKYKGDLSVPRDNELSSLWNR